MKVPQAIQPGTLQKHTREAQVSDPGMCSRVEDWYRWVDSQPGFVLLDGGLGSTLSQRGNSLDVGSMWSGRLLLSNRTELQQLALAWLQAGADILATATYQATTELIKAEFHKSQGESESVMQSAVQLLVECRGRFWNSLSEAERSFRRYPKVAISMGPYSAILPGTNEYSGRYSGVSKQELLCFHRDRCAVFDKLLLHPSVEQSEGHLYCFETIGNTEESLAIVDIMSEGERSTIPYSLSFQCRDRESLACGDKLATIIGLVLGRCSSKNLVAIGVNCISVNDVEALTESVSVSLRHHMDGDRSSVWRVDTTVCPNSGEVWSEQGWQWPSEELVYDTHSWAGVTVSSGAKLVGGCCRVDTGGIKALHKRRAP